MDGGFGVLGDMTSPQRPEFQTILCPLNLRKARHCREKTWPIFIYFSRCSLQWSRWKTCNVPLIKTAKVLTNTVLFDMSRLLIPLMTGLCADSNSVSNSNRCRVRATLNDWYWLAENGLNRPHQSAEGQAKSERLAPASQRVDSGISGAAGSGISGDEQCFHNYLVVRITDGSEACGSNLIDCTLPDTFMFPCFTYHTRGAHRFGARLLVHAQRTSAS